jgi:hypothetical protein
MFFNEFIEFIEFVEFIAFVIPVCILMPGPCAFA